LDGLEVCHKSPILIDSCVDACLERLVSGHDRDIIHENAVHDAIRPWALLSLSKHRQEIEFEF
jgi:hypothetical protein